MRLNLHLQKFFPLCLVLFISLGLSGCSWLQAVKNYRAGEMLEHWFDFQSPEYLADYSSITQKVVAEYQDKSVVMIHQVEINDGTITLVGLGHLGGSLFNLQLSNEGFEHEVSPLMPKLFHPGYLLRDWQVSFWPEQSVRSGLHDGYLLRMQGNDRLIKHGDETVQHVSYAGAGLWQGLVTYKNIKRGYTLTFETLSIELK